MISENADETAALQRVALGDVDRTSIHGLEARLSAIRTLLPHLEVTVDLIETLATPPTSSRIRLGHTMLDQAVNEPTFIS